MNVKQLPSYMNTRQFEISIRSRYSWTNQHNHDYVLCRKCNQPLLPSEYGIAIELGKILPDKLPERCAECETRKRLKKEEKSRESKLEKSRIAAEEKFSETTEEELVIT